LKKNVQIFILGSLVSISLISPPGFLRLTFIELSDFLILIFSFILFFDFIQKKKNIDFSSKITRFWFSLIFVLTLSLIIYGINFSTSRLIFYCITGFLFSVFLQNKPANNLQYFLFPFAIVSILNFVSSIFQLSFVDNTIGWITYYYENPSFFDRGRLSGFQGSGPNVAGGMFSILTFLSMYFYTQLKNYFFLFLSVINLYLVFITFSRGSYLSLLIGLIGFIFIKGNVKQLVVLTFVFIIGTLGFLTFFNSSILLKESDRGFLTQIAFENMNFTKGLGPGNYVESIYKDYFLSINPEILEQNLNINLNKVELGITPEEYRNSNVNFFIGTSGGGYEILVQSKLVSECSEDRITCQHVRVKKELFTNLFSAIYQIGNDDMNISMNESNCFDGSNLNILRGEAYCFFDFIYENYENSEKIPQNLTYVPCSDPDIYNCKNRELAIGELAVMVEKLSISNDYVPYDNYKAYCKECNFRDVVGYIKFKFDKKDGILPRSIISFYTSEDQLNWDMVGYQRTSGGIINLNENTSYIEIGGHSDGQSFGNTFLDSTIKEVSIISNGKDQKILFLEDNINEDYYVFKPNQINSYTSKITYENSGIKLFRPNKYWLAIENNFDFTEDFEIVLKLSFPEIPWERQTLISNTSITDGQVQSWKLEIDDGRLFFYWADEEGVFLETNTIGDKSLRSGVMVQQDGKISNTNPPIVDPSFLSQLTTAHNGYLTFSVEYGLIISILFHLIIGIAIFKVSFFVNNENIFPYLAIWMFLIQNITNDMIYSPDMMVLFVISIGIFIQSSKSFEFKKS
tara:strand:+ start:41 stop:2437 length:2397 start_codon:yes stop_codon:yes gene_type:complete